MPSTIKVIQWVKQQWPTASLWLHIWAHLSAQAALWWCAALNNLWHAICMEALSCSRWCCRSFVWSKQANADPNTCRCYLHSTSRRSYLPACLLASLPAPRLNVMYRKCIKDGSLSVFADLRGVQHSRKGGWADVEGMSCIRDIKILMAEKSS